MAHTGPTTTFKSGFGRQLRAILSALISLDYRAGDAGTATYVHHLYDV